MSDSFISAATVQSLEVLLPTDVACLAIVADASASGANANPMRAVMFAAGLAFLSSGDVPVPPAASVEHVLIEGTPSPSRELAEGPEVAPELGLLNEADAQPLVWRHFHSGETPPSARWLGQYVIVAEPNVIEILQGDGVQDRWTEGGVLGLRDGAVRLRGGWVLHTGGGHATLLREITRPGGNDDVEPSPPPDLMTAINAGSGDGSDPLDSTGRALRYAEVAAPVAGDLAARLAAPLRTPPAVARVRAWAASVPVTEWRAACLRLGQDACDLLLTLPGRDRLEEWVTWMDEDAGRWKAGLDGAKAAFGVPGVAPTDLQRACLDRDRLENARVLLDNVVRVHPGVTAERAAFVGVLLDVDRTAALLGLRADDLPGDVEELQAAGLEGPAWWGQSARVDR